MAPTISEAISDDHASIDLYAENLRTATDDAEKVRWRNQLTWTLARHAISEELTLYPAMEHHLGEEGVKEYLYQLQDMTPVDPKFAPLLETLMDVLHHHIEHEKNEDMPRLEGLLSREESEALARKFERTKGIVPTRSHPAAPTEYYLENLAGLLVAPIDRLTMWLRDFPDERDVREAEGRTGEKAKI